MKTHFGNEDIIMYAGLVLEYLAEIEENQIVIATAGGISVRIATLVHKPAIILFTFNATLALARFLAYLHTIPKGRGSIHENAPWQSEHYAGIMYDFSAPRRS